MGLNQCTFLGRLTRDPEIRYSSGADQIPIARFTLAVDRWKKKDGESEADFFRVWLLTRKQNLQKNTCTVGFGYW